MDAFAENQADQITRLFHFPSPNLYKCTQLNMNICVDSWGKNKSITR